MPRLVIRPHLVVWCSVLTACGSISESDPQFWTPSHDLGAKNYEFGAPAAPGGGGDVPVASGGAFVGGGGAGGVVQPPSSGGGTPLPTGGTFGTGGTEATGGSFVGGGGTVPPDPTSSGGATPPPPPPPPGNPEACKLTFAVTTVTARGRYAPRNVGAIWISDAQGKFVKALEVWGQIRLGNATAWTSASLGQNVDVVTAATRPNHGAHSVTWDCRDPSGTPVPFGTYQAHVTFAESDAFPFFGPPPIQSSMSFERNGTPIQTDGTDSANFTSMHVGIE